jgi:hypothetical protein
MRASSAATWLLLALGTAAGCSAVSGLSGLDFDRSGNGGSNPSGGGQVTTNGGAGAQPDGGSGGASTCSDHRKDGDETDVDCGGSCPKCALGLGCNETKDCANGECTDSFCQTAPVGVWEQLEPVTNAADRFGCSMGWDGSSVRLLQGMRQDESIAGAMSYLWTGTTWTEIVTLPAAFPRRYRATTISSNVGMLIFGGNGSAVLDDTWILPANQSTWLEANTADAPTARQLGAGAADATNAILFGGSLDADEPLGDTWGFNGTAWIQLHPAHSPPARFSATMAYDLRHDRAVLFGGSGKPNTAPLGDYWLWDGSDWTKGTATAPPARYGAVMVYAPIRGRVVVSSGGTAPTTYASDTWEWNGTSWAMTSTHAPPLYEACAAYDMKRQRLVFYGGSAGATVSSETWEYHVHGDACRKDADCETGHCVDHLCCEQSACGSCERCNDVKAPGVCTACASCSNTKCD